MRRSSSTSHIPMPKVSLAARKLDFVERPRSRSVVRSSNDYLMTPLASTLRSRPQSTLAVPGSSTGRCTPVVVAGSSQKKWDSTAKLTPGTNRRCPRSRSTTPTTNMRRQTIFINNKQWVNDKFGLVKSFVSETFDLEFAQQIKRPTIQVFVTLMTKLFQLIINVGPITNQNYVDVVLQTLKTLQYPAQITVSTLKAINTSHGWPHFIAITHWLIEKNEFVMNLDKNEGSDSIFFEFLNTQFQINTSPNPDDAIMQTAINNLHTRISQIVGINHDSVEAAEEVLKQNRAKLNEENAKIKEFQMEIDNLEKENAKYAKFIQEYESTKDTRELQLEEELYDLKETVTKLTNQKQELMASIKDLKRTKAKQKYSVDQKKELSRDIAQLKSELERRARRRQAFQKERDFLIERLDILKAEVREKVDEWNDLITKCFVPELEVLYLKNLQYFDSFAERIRAIRQDKAPLEKKLLEEYITSEIALRQVTKEIEDLKASDKSAGLNLRFTNKLKSSLDEIEAANRAIKLDIDESIRAHKERVHELEKREAQQLNELKEMAASLETKKQALIKQIQEAGQSGLNDLKKARDTVIDEMNKIGRAMENRVNVEKENLQAAKKRTEKQFNRLKEVRAATGKIEEVINNLK